MLTDGIKDILVKERSKMLLIVQADADRLADAQAGVDNLMATWKDSSSRLQEIEDALGIVKEEKPEPKPEPVPVEAAPAEVIQET